MSKKFPVIAKEKTCCQVLLINEPFVEDFCRTQRWAARTRGRVLRPPDWLAYATAVLEKEGITAELYDFPAKRWDKPELRQLVAQKQPELVVLDCTTPSVYSDIECARICKEACPSCRVLMVGPHASVQDEEVLRDAAGAVDAIARGEYEFTVRDFARAVLAKNAATIIEHRNENNPGTKIPGTCESSSEAISNHSLWNNPRKSSPYSPDVPFPGAEENDKSATSQEWASIEGLSWLDADSSFRRNPDRPLISNLDDLPFPAWHHLDPDDYFDGTKLFPYFDIIGGRGCPFQCAFCLWPQVMHGNRYRLRSPQNIVDEMEWVLSKWPQAKHGEFFFEDDTFTVDPARAHAICDEILRRSIRCRWSVNSRADVCDENLFRHMKKAGCRLVLVGFESANQEMLDRMNKRLNLLQMRNFIHTAKKAGLAIHGCFVLGLPGETEASMRETIDFALKEDLDTVQFSGAVPFPGTKYFTYCRDNGLLRAKRWDEWLQDGEQSPVVDYPGLSWKLVESYVNQGLKRFYFRPSYMLKFLFNTRGKSDLYRKLRGAKNFFSYLLAGS
ncbi:MAG: radical SAM protein [Candidatus Ozemobacteraceae bacterium]